MFLPAYFPRSAQEAINQVELLPEDIGNEWGERVIEQRVLKVSAGPKPVEGCVPKPIGGPLPPGKLKTGKLTLPYQQTSIFHVR